MPGHDDFIPLFGRCRNAAVGMALIYLECLESIWRPLAFSGRHIGTYLAALLHILTPLLAAWLATHWSERMEAAMWGGSIIENAMAFAATWLLMLIAWSVVWILARGAISALARLMAQSPNAALSTRTASRPALVDRP